MFTLLFIAGETKHNSILGVVGVNQPNGGALCDLVPFVQFRKREKHP